MSDSHEFSFATVKNFDEHISMSIRGYGDLIDDVIKFSSYFVEDGTTVLDIGCSTGRLLKRMIEINTFAPNAYYRGVEIEEKFFDNYQEDMAKLRNLEFHKCDICDYDKFENLSYATSVFTLQFIPQKNRTQVIQNVYNGLNQGGAFVICEKTYSKNSKLQDMLSMMYYDFKKQHFTEEEILSKEVSLRHMLKPVTKYGIIKELKNAGFKTIEVFWQQFNFVGVIGLK